MGAGPPQLADSPHPAPRKQGRAGRRWAGPVGPAAPVRGAEPAPQGGRAHTRRRIWHLVSQPGSRSPKFPPCTLPGVPLTASRRKEPRWGCANTSPDTPGPLRGPSPHPPRCPLGARGPLRAPQPRPRRFCPQARGWALLQGATRREGDEQGSATPSSTPSPSPPGQPDPRGSPGDRQPLAAGLRPLPLSRASAWGQAPGRGAHGHLPLASLSSMKLRRETGTENPQGTRAPGQL